MSDEEMLNWAIEYLERDEEIIVPIKKMWNEWHALHGAPSLEIFTAVVLADDRVEKEDGVDHTDGMEDLSPEELEEYVADMEANGYFSGPRARLKLREITLEHVQKMIKRHNDRMIDSLRQARAAMPDDMDETQEGQLIEIIAKAEELRKKLREAGLEPPEGTGDDGG